jgi:hypothetical protein
MRITRIVQILAITNSRNIAECCGMFFHALFLREPVLFLLHSAIQNSATQFHGAIFKAEHLPFSAMQCLSQANEP